MLACGVYALAAGGSASDDRCSAPSRSKKNWLDAMTLWVGVGGTAGVLLALKAALVHGDHSWAGGVTLAVSVAAGLLAVQTRMPSQVFVSGLLLNVAGFIGWLAWGESAIDTFLLTQALCFGVGAARVGGLAMALHRPTEEATFRLTWPALVQPFTHLGSLFGLCVLVRADGRRVFGSLTHLNESSGGVLPWWTWSRAVPFALRLGDARPWLPLGAVRPRPDGHRIALNHARLSTTTTVDAAAGWRRTWP